MPADQCPDCGAAFRPGTTACPACGTELPGGEPAGQNWLPRLLELARARSRALRAPAPGNDEPYILVTDEAQLIFQGEDPLSDTALEAIRDLMRAGRKTGFTLDGPFHPRTCNWQYPTREALEAAFAPPTAADPGGWPALQSAPFEVIRDLNHLPPNPCGPRPYRQYDTVAATRRGSGEERTSMAGYPDPHAGITGSPNDHPLLSLDDTVQVRRDAVTRIQQMPFWDRCQPPRPGGFAIEWSLASAGFPDGWQPGIGVLLARREERPWPASTDPRTEEVFYIQYGPGPDDICRWTNTDFYAVPPQVAVNNPRSRP